MNRVITLLLTTILIVSVATISVAAKDDRVDEDDTKVTAEMCKKNGWKDLKDANGKPFKNQGQCVSYAKHGGELQGIEPDESDDVTPEVADDSDTSAADSGGEASSTATATSTSTPEAGVPVLVIVDGQDPWNGYLEGSGFTPGATLTKVMFESDREALTLASPVGTVIEADGTFITERIIYWCTEFDGHGATVGTVTVEDSSGATYKQTFEMASHCEGE